HAQSNCRGRTKPSHSHRDDLLAGFGNTSQLSPRQGARELQDAEIVMVCRRPPPITVPTESAVRHRARSHHGFFPPRVLASGFVEVSGLLEALLDLLAQDWRSEQLGGAAEGQGERNRPGVGRALEG